MTPLNGRDKKTSNRPLRRNKSPRQSTGLLQISFSRGRITRIMPPLITNIIYITIVVAYINARR